MASKITDLHPEILLTHILTHHSSLASTALCSTQLHALCNHDNIWTILCNSKWPSTEHLLVRNAIYSFLGSHHSFFSDSYGILEFDNGYKYWCYNGPDTTQVQRPEYLISAVDIQFENKIIYSKVDVTDTSAEIFASSSFKFEAVDKESVTLPMKSEDEEDIHISKLKINMILSWIDTKN